MNARERVIRAIEFEGPDRIPNGCYALPGTFYKYGKKIEELFNRFPSDFHQFVSSWTEVTGDSIPYKGGINKDPWGCVWKNLNPGLFGRIIEHPLADLKNLENYKLPDISELVNFDEVEKSIRLSGHERYILGDSENFFERLHWLHGFSNTLIDLMKGKKELMKLIDLLFDFKIKFIKRWLELDVDGIYFLDDWGTMQGLMINPELWRKIFKPLYKEMFDVVHCAGRHVFFHSDGYILDIIPDLIEIGVDALNVQVKLMGIDKLKEKLGGKVCLLADIDRQYILPFGTTKDVEDHVKHIIQAFSDFDGGLIAWGEIGPDVPLSNAEAMLKTFWSYGRYPICIR
ncbi:MAG: uroporphyrinogen decarboxylase family protein [Candidatus Methanomethylicaceae archaeon]